MPNVKIIKAAKGPHGYSVNVSVENDSTNLVKTVEVTVHSSTGQPDPEPQTVALEYDYSIEGIRYFSNSSLNFSSNATGLTYNMTAKLLNASGQSLSSSAQNVTIQEAEVLA